MTIIFHEKSCLDNSILYDIMMNTHDRQLIKPKSHIPWSVDIIRAAPKRLMNGLDPQKIASCAAVGWAAMTTGDGYVHVWQSKTITMSGKTTLESPKSVKVFLPDLILADDELASETIHLALCASQGEAELESTMVDSVHLFVYHAGWLYLKKVTSKELQPPPVVRGAHAKTRVDLGEYESHSEYITSLMAAPGLVVLATSIGNLYWVAVTPIPVGLHIQKVSPKTGWLSRVVFGANDANATSTGVVSSCLVLPLSSTEFLSISQNCGTLLRWKVTVTVGTAHHATFELVHKGILDLSQSSLLDQLSDLAVSQAALSSDGKSMHCLVSGMVDGRSKMFWIHAEIEGILLRTTWISRFAEPSQVTIAGIVTTEDESAYAAFFQPSVGTTTVMVLSPNEEVVHEVDLPVTHVPSLLANMLERDTMTHGCTVMTSIGLGLRVRFIPQDSPPSAKKARYSTSGPSSPGAPMNYSLVSHLRSAFWQAYQDPEIHRPLPPSLHAASVETLEHAIVTLAMELQQKGDASSAQNPMEWHGALIKFLQERGLYKSVSQEGRWQLFSIGQELAVFGHVTHFRRGIYTSGLWECKSYEMADWLLNLQQAGTAATDWNELLSGLVKVAMEYREAEASLFYDVLNESTPPQPVWLSHKSVQQVLRRQLEEWHQNPTSIERSHAENVVKAALASYSEFYPDKADYKAIQKLSITLLRSLHKPNDAVGDGHSMEELAFELSVHYDYFEGLCQISVDHEKERDASLFSLDPLFEAIKGKDVITGYTFAQFVLQWHTDNGLYGHTINYGRHAPNELTMLMKTDERLRQYKWIPAIRQSFFDQATESFLSNAGEGDQGSLRSMQWALSMAKLSNQLVASQNHQRQQFIDRKLDLVSAQQMLQEGTTMSPDGPPQTPQQLVLLALQRLQDAPTMDDRVRFATIALAVCNSMDDNSMSIDSTANVWAEALRLDESLWMTWLKMESDLTSRALKHRVMADTVFGALLSECRKDKTMSTVCYGRHIESAVLDKVGGDVTKLEFSRLLRSVTASSDSIQAQSLVVASY